MPQARLDALHTLLAGLVARPEPGVLVIGCTDIEVFYLVHTLTRIDEDSPADRFLIHADNLIAIDDYVPNLCRAAELPVPSGAPAAQFHALCTTLLAELPAGDHHLTIALLPTEIHDPSGLTDLVAHILQLPLDPRLRIIVRDDRVHPRHIELAAASPSQHHLAHVFSLPPEFLLASVQATAQDPGKRPDDRAQALLQLACQDLGHGRYAEALARCEAVQDLSTTEPLKLLALAFKADVLRRSGDAEAALTLGLATIHSAVELQAHPIVLHLALSLAELTRELGRPTDVIACLELAEKSALFNHEVQARIRGLRAEVQPC